jgi:DNA-3-methyladenine glycosylase
MFGPAGMTYVYLIYGMYHCLNIVTDRDGVPSAVLLRALQLEQVPTWIDPKERQERIAAGPGKLCRALQIDLSLTARPLQPGYPLWLEPRSPQFQQSIATGEGGKGLPELFVQKTRIGLTQGKDLPWRWYVKNSPAVSRR